jgi:hypothetical protein
MHPRELCRGKGHNGVFSSSTDYWILVFVGQFSLSVRMWRFILNILARMFGVVNSSVVSKSREIMDSRLLWSFIPRSFGI